MQTAGVPWAVLATPNLSSKFCDGRRDGEAHLPRVAQDHLRPVAEKADKPGHANPLSFQRRFGSASELCPIVPVDHRGQCMERVGLIGVNHGDKCWVGLDPSPLMKSIPAPEAGTSPRCFRSGAGRPWDSVRGRLIGKSLHDTVGVTVTALADRAQRLSAADAIATFALYIVGSTGWGEIHPCR